MLRERSDIVYPSIRSGDPKQQDFLDLKQHIRDHQKKSGFGGHMEAAPWL